MILRSVVVENWRCLRRPLQLAPLQRGLNLIHGPNEAGKSTLLDAICLGFYDRHNAGGPAIAARQPWGTALGPTVTIEFELGEIEPGQGLFRLRKRFVESPLAELHQRVDDRWEKVARGRSADDRILELLNASLAGRGLSKPEHWGIGQVLWVRHGEGNELTVGGSQQARLREALRITLDTARSEAIEQAIRERHEAVFTGRGKLRSRAEVTQLATQLADAEQHAQRLQSALDDLERATATLAEAKQERRRLRQARERGREALRERRLDLDALSEQRRGHERALATAERARGDFQRLERHAARIAEVDRAALAAKEGQQGARAAVDEAEAQVDAALALREAMVREVAAAKEKLAQSERALRWLQCNRDLERARCALDDAGRVADSVAQTRDDLQRLGGPSQIEIRQLREIDREARTLRARIEAASLSVTIEPEGTLAVESAVDGVHRQIRQLTRPTTLRAIGRLDLDLRGVGRISVRGGNTGAADPAAELERSEARYADLLASCGVSADAEGAVDLDRLEDLAGRRVELEQRLAALQQRQRELQPAEQLQRRVVALEDRRRELLERGESLTFCWDTFERAASAVLQERELAAAELTAVERSLEQARAQLESARQALSEARQDHARALATLEERQAEARRLRAEDRLTDEQRAEAVAAARRSLAQSERALEAVAFSEVDDLERQIGAIEASLAELEQRLGEQQRLIGSLERDVERAGNEGLYSQLAVAVEQREIIRRRLAQARLDAEGIALLWRTVQHRKRGVLDTLLEPVREQVTASLVRLVGDRYSEVGFSDDLAPESVRPAAWADTARIEDLSYGTRGQLMLLTRLAIARLLARGLGRQCVLVEDPLTATDTARQLAAISLLQEAASEVQILVFTCHPEAYDRLQGAARFDLEGLVR